MQKKLWSDVMGDTYDPAHWSAVAPYRVGANNGLLVESSGYQRITTQAPTGYSGKASESILTFNTVTAEIELNNPSAPQVGKDIWYEFHIYVDAANYCWLGINYHPGGSVAASFNRRFSGANTRVGVGVVLERGSSVNAIDLTKAKVHIEASPLAYEGQYYAPLGEATPTKVGRIIRTQYFYFSKLYLDVELKIVGGTSAYLAMFINDVKVAESYTNESDYTRVGLTWDWTGLTDNIWYDIEFRIKAVGGGTVYNRGLQLISHKPGVSGQ